MGTRKPSLPVIFKVFKEGDVIAFFPNQPGTCEWQTCSSYQHVGQHGAANVALIGELRPAKPTEYAPLLRELRGIYDDCKLIVMRRRTRKHDRERAEALKR